MLIKHSIIYFLGKLAPALLSIVGVMIYTRLVNPTEYGLFSLIIVITGLINILFFQWIRSSFIRFYNDRENVDSFIGSIVKSHIITLMLLAIPILIMLVIFHIKGMSIWYVVIGYLIVILLSVFEMFIIYFRTILKPTLVANGNIIKALLVVIVSTVLIYYGAGTIGLLMGSVFGLAIGIVFFIRQLVIGKIRRLSLEFSKTTQMGFLKYGLPITLSFALSVALQNIDKIMISSILGLEENGNYSVSYDLMHNMIYMIMMSISLAGFPIILRVIKKAGGEAGKRKFKDYSGLLLFISIPACFGLASILNEFTGIVIGNQYSISNKLMILIIIGSFFHGIKSYYFDLTLQISAKTKYFFVPVIAAVFINIILNIYMLNKYGIEGAALATAISFFVAMLISTAYSIRNYRVSFPWQDCLKILSTSLVMYLVIINISIGNDLLSLLSKIVVGMIVYTLLNFLINTLHIRKVFMDKVMKR